MDKDYISEIKEGLLNDIRMAGEVSEEEIREMIFKNLNEASLKKHLSIKEKKELSEWAFNSLCRLGLIQELVEDESVSEIMINGPSDIFLEKGGRLFKWDKVFDNDFDLENLIQQIVSGTNRMVNETSPIVDTRLYNGARVNVVLKPIALNGPIVTIRRFPENPYTMEELIEKDTISKELADFLRTLVMAGYNIFISGGTGSGKTTFLNALSEYIPVGERIITIEDSAELNIKGIENLVRLESRNANSEGANEVTIRDLIKTALRMRPDRIIVGEIRGAEALDMLQAMNTGHDGSLSTGHANSPKDMLKRIETMILMGSADLPLAAIRGQIASGIDIMVHLSRIRDRSRKVLEIDEVEDIINGEIILRPLYRFHEEREEGGKVWGSWIKEGELLKREKLALKGIRL